MLKANIILSITSKELKISPCALFDKRFNSFESRGPLSYCLLRLCRNESSRSHSIHMDMSQAYSFIFHVADQTDFHLIGFARSLVRCLSWCLLYTAQNRMLMRTNANYNVSKDGPRTYHPLQQVYWIFRPYMLHITSCYKIFIAQLRFISGKKIYRGIKYFLNGDGSGDGS